MANLTSETVVEDCEDACRNHDWVDAVEGPEVVGKVCAVCGAQQDFGDDFDDNYF